MSNYVLSRADRATHLKIVVVSLLAGILVIGVGVAARTPASSGTLAIDNNTVTVKTTKPMWSSREAGTIR